MELLRTANVVARARLDTDFAKWLRLETEGYPAGQELPPYRVVAARLRVRNSVREAPVSFDAGDPREKHFSACPIFQPIAMVAKLAASNNLSVTLEAAELDLLLESNPDLRRCHAFMRIEPSSLVGILDAVQTRILNWALDLEVLKKGDSMQRSKREQDRGRGSSVPHRTVAPLHFEDLGGNHFERLSYEYVSRTREWKSISWDGQCGGDDGADIRCTRPDGSVDAFQCANHRELKFAKARDDLGKLRQHPEGFPTRFTLIAGGKVSASLKRRIVAHAKSLGSAEAYVWSSADFEVRLRNERPDLVDRFFFGEQLHGRTDGESVEEVDADAHAFAELDRREVGEAERARTCTEEQASTDFAAAKELLRSAHQPRRERAYDHLKLHTRCKHRNHLIKILTVVWESRKSPPTVADRALLLRHLAHAQAWGFSDTLMTFWITEPTAAVDPLASALQGYFYEAICQRTNPTLTLLVRGLRKLAKSGAPLQPTNTFLTFLDRLGERHPDLSEKQWTGIRAAILLYRNDLERFPVVRALLEQLGL